MSNQINVTRSSMPSFEEYCAEIQTLWESCWITNSGAKHHEFEALLQQYLDVDYISLFTNGHNALECAIEALQLGSDGRKKVITTPFTFASTTHAIVRRGLDPVFADITRSNYTIDSEDVEHLIDEDTCAIVPVHVYGNICDVDALQALADKYDLKLIYDAAHAFGVQCQNNDGTWQSAASFGDASMLSFHATKVFHSIEGGAVCFHDPALIPIFNQIKDFGITDPESVESVGTNAKLNEFCAAMGICNLRHINEEIAKRKQVAELYYEQLSDIEGLKLSQPPANIMSNYAYMPVVFEDAFGATRDQVFDVLAAQGIGARKYFYPLITDYACYREEFDSSKTPIAQDIAVRILTLPIYADLDLEDVQRICEIVRGCAR